MVRVLGKWGYLWVFKKCLISVNVFLERWCLYEVFVYYGLG